MTITVTALKGNGVGYTFEPHGTVFNAPVVITQTYKGTEAEKNADVQARLLGAYSPNLDALTNTLGTTLVTELRPTQVDVGIKELRFTVDHFSGYVVASGRSGAASAF